jgi:hypothetical protein
MWGPGRQTAKGLLGLQLCETRERSIRGLQHQWVGSLSGRSLASMLKIKFSSFVLNKTDQPSLAGGEMEQSLSQQR